jgi:D-alanyl-D-alanine carboxypeptidase
MNTERLGSERHLPHLLDAPRLRRKRGGSLQQLLPVAGGDGELKTREQDTDDHADERMFASGADGHATRH